MRFFHIILLFSIFFALPSCKNKPAPQAEATSSHIRKDTTVAEPSSHQDTIRYPICLGYDIPASERARRLKEAAMAGDADALNCLWGDLLFNANSLTNADPEQAYSIYLEVKKKNPQMQIADEERKLSTIRKCIEAGPFEDASFSKEYHVWPDSANAEFSVWELARDISLGRIKGGRNPKLLLQVVCRGGSIFSDLTGAVDTVYYCWKHNKAIYFEPINYIIGNLNTAFSGGTYTFLTVTENKIDNNWRISRLGPLLGDTVYRHVYGALRIAKEFHKRQSWRENGDGGRMDNWISDQTASKYDVGYVDLIERVCHDSLPMPLAGDDSSDIKLNVIYKKIIARWRIHPHYGFQQVSEFVDEERKWIAYRDSTAQLFAMIRPDTDRSKWLEWLTESRVNELHDFYETFVHEP